MVKIVIVGAGISGLSTYLFLRKHLPGAQITIYESHDIGASNFSAFALTGHTPEVFAPQAVGAGIGLSRNGLMVLARLDDDTPTKQSPLIRELARKGYPIDRWNMATARGFSIANVDLGGARKTDTEEGGMYWGIMIARQACWEILRDRVSAQVVVRKKVVDVSVSDKVVHFEDGSCESADLIIGADGLRSVVRRAMFSHSDTHKVDDQHHPPTQSSWWTTLLRRSNTSDTVDYISPQYEGLVGLGGFIPSSVLASVNHIPGTMSIVFGPNGFFGYGYLTSAESPKEDESHETQAATATATAAATSREDPSGALAAAPLAGWWSTFSSETPYPFAVGDTFDRRAALASLRERHRHWRHPGVAAVVKHVLEVNDATTTTTSDVAPTATACGGGGGASRALLASYPTWTTPELPHWNVGGVVLVGDAAHALQPSSGQGASQALEDAEALALFLKHELTNGGPQGDGAPREAAGEAAGEGCDADVAAALTAYHRLRSPRVHQIFETSQRMSRMKADMNWLAEWLMYLFIYLSTLFGGNKSDQLLHYDLPAEVERALQKQHRGDH